ncbi:hypothetical protein ID853_11415 [Xenorhabdus sp. Vera]|uniref:hypothetical protein n=1 Tax=Xenorhabdus koppenhoeferi TaxID=351659 RepID=UPI0019CED394|nr:hypothetical protein [Xenorhabdus sp. Vera]MBD2811476.1 hypothetical protein [Xenorhabdus sp. Vera]
MAIEDILKNVTRRAKNTFSSGSSTHIPFHTKDIDVVGENEICNPNIKKLFNGSDLVNDQIRQMRARLRSKSIDYSHTFYTINKFKKNLGGNCHELSQYVFHDLIKNYSFEIFNFYRGIDNNSTYIVMCGAPKPYDHTFVTIYHPSTTENDPISKLQHLQPEAWICDPWADIICKGLQYPYEWDKTMKTWYDNSHYIITNESLRYSEVRNDRYNQFFSPLRDQAYYTIPILLNPNSKIDLYYLAFINSKGELNQITTELNITDYNISQMDNMNHKKLYNYYNEEKELSKPIDLSDITTEKLIEKARINLENKSK